MTTTDARKRRIAELSRESIDRMDADRQQRTLDAILEEVREIREAATFVPKVVFPSSPRGQGAPLERDDTEGGQWPTPEAVRASLAALDGSDRSAVKVMTGLTDEDIDDVGGLPDEARVCISHGAFIPCRSDGMHRVTSNPYWVKSVQDHHGSPYDYPWTPALEHHEPDPERDAVDARTAKAVERLQAERDEWAQDSREWREQAVRIQDELNALRGDIKYLANLWSVIEKSYSRDSRRKVPVSEPWTNAKQVRDALRELLEDEP